MWQDTTAAVPAVVNEALTWRDFLLPLLPLLQARVTVPLVELLKRLSTWIDGRSAWQKQVLVVSINALIAATGVALGVDVKGIDDLTTVTVAALLGSALSLAAHAGQTAKENKQAIEAATQPHG